MSLKADYLIVGQGIAGILIGFELIQSGRSCFFMDDGDALTASHAASALINPININTGNPFPNQNEELEIALQTYRHLEKFLTVPFLQELNLFILQEDKKSKKYIDNNFLKPSPEAEMKALSKYFFQSYFFQKQLPVHKIQFEMLKKDWGNHWQKKGCYFTEKFNYTTCRFLNKKIIYKDLEVFAVIFTEGVKGASNPYFQKLPFTANLGNVLHLKIDELPCNWAFHLNGKKLLPLGNKEFWFGSNYQWNFKETNPNPIWQKETDTFLKNQLRIPFEIIDHIAVQRPTTAGQIPLLLQDKKHPQLYFFNGLGTRGFSRGPFLAKHFREKYFTN